MNFPEISYSPLREEDYFQINRDGKEAPIKVSTIRFIEPSSTNINSCINRHHITPKYIGCIGIKESMRRLSHKARSKVATEAINRLCEVNSIDRMVLDHRRSDKIRGLLEDEPNLTHSGRDVLLSVTPTHLNVSLRDTQQIIIQHEMRDVSFVSSGDKDTVDFVAYVAKNAKFGRACFVLDCGYDTVAEDLFNKIAQGFELRTKKILGLPRENTYTESTLPTTECLDTSYDQSNIPRNQPEIDIVALTRNSLEKEPWYHGAYLTREESETRLKHDGDFLVRESMLDAGNFVLSVMHEKVKLHLLFDSIEQVKTKEMVFDNISHLVKYHHDEGLPIVADKRIIYLLNGVPRPKLK